jgi:hypothetical protein
MFSWLQRIAGLDRRVVSGCACCRQGGCQWRKVGRGRCLEAMTIARIDIRTARQCRMVLVLECRPQGRRLERRNPGFIEIRWARWSPVGDAQRGSVGCGGDGGSGRFVQKVSTRQKDLVATPASYPTLSQAKVIRNDPEGRSAMGATRGERHPAMMPWPVWLPSEPNSLASAFVCFRRSEMWLKVAESR